MTTDQSKAPAPSVGGALLTKALDRAFSLGQTYWQQADSESYSQNAKSDVTLAKFRAFRDETIAALTSQPPAPASVEEHLRELLECWIHDGRLQTFEDRQRFRVAARAALNPSGAESLGVKEQSQEVHPVEPGSGPLSTWVSVDDRLPHDPSKALVWYVPSKNSPHILFVWFSGGEWRFTDRTGDTRLSERVTHWMPLPQPPTGAQTPNADQVASSSGPLPLSATAERKA